MSNNNLKENNGNTADGDRLLFHTKPITVMALNDFAPRQFILKRFGLERGMLVSVCGTGNSGKTLFVQYLATCFASNNMVFDKYTDCGRGMKVLHIDQEQSETLTARRYSRLACAAGVSSLAIDRMQLPVKLDDASVGRAAMKKHLVGLFSKYQLVIIDSLRASVNCDENNSQIADSVHLIRECAEASKALVLLIHHMGKSNGSSKQSGRGSSAIYDAVDGQIDVNGRNGSVEVSCAKIRDGVFFKGLSFEFVDTGEFVEHQNCKTKLELRLTSDDLPQREVSKKMEICILLKERGELNRGQIFDAVGGKATALDEAMNELVQQNVVITRTGYKNAKLYSLGDNANVFMDYEGGAL